MARSASGRHDALNYWKKHPKTRLNASTIGNTTRKLQDNLHELYRQGDFKPWIAFQMSQYWPEGKQGIVSFRDELEINAAGWSQCEPKRGQTLHSPSFFWLLVWYFGAKRMGRTELVKIILECLTYVCVQTGLDVDLMLEDLSRISSMRDDP